MFRAGFLCCSLATKNIDMFSMRGKDELISVSSASWTSPPSLKLINKNKAQIFL